ncbi:Fpg/Nei family DNA glycosylase [Paenibacillus harenae]|uniref:Formamidopyrimidine-DNA glycosylase n=1 Tax=Paenibacillus harenae TaxID=306543 RepID=A0ABT9TWA2_PAEHA|nr:DNA-formamidopyrimidine glycosylase family protein [Paenibacillus harenae]MDQ0111372.1 formamidopyrimidine-DNA glycosylase [Paenibacillus harenae]
MLELPELENDREVLADRFAGAQITGIEVTSSKTFQIDAEQLRKEVVGAVVWFVERRGKHLLFHLDNGKRLVLQLTGAAYLYIGTLEDMPDKSTQVRVKLGEQILYLIGLRSEHLKLMTVREVEELFGGLGADPLDKKLTLNRFIDRFAKKRGAIRPALLDTNVLNALGSAYVDEILFRAELLPDAKIPLFEPATWERLYEAMHNVLKEAISNGGAGDFPLTADDRHTGGHKQKFRVHDREGEACLVCGSTIDKLEQSGRKAYYCPGCQKDL